MGIRVELEVLAVLLVLTPIVSDGMRMNKCELMDQIISKANADDQLVATSVCHAEMTSHFETSLISHVPSPDLPGIRKTRSVAKAKTATKAHTKTTNKTTTKAHTNTSTKAHTNTTTKAPAKTTTKAPAKTTINHLLKTTENAKFQSLSPKPQNSSNEINQDHEINETKSSMPLLSKYLNTEVKLPPSPPSNSTYMEPRNKSDGNNITLYGIFQLPGFVACTSSKQLSLNICNLTCDSLIDNEISDDIKCFLTIRNSVWSYILRSTCPFKDFTQYIAECKTP